jgi:hypothetical protein
MEGVVIVVFLLLIILAIGVSAGHRTPRKKAQSLGQSRAVSNSQATKVAAAHSETLYKPHLENEDGERFEGWIGEHFGDSVDKQLLTKVAGVTFANPDGTSRQELISQCKKYQPLRLVAEPENPYDRDAVRIETMHGSQLGYLPRNFNLPFGPDRWHAVVRAVNPADVTTPASLIVCLLRIAENHPISESDGWFMEQVGSKTDRHYLWRIERYHGLNPDGSDRQVLIAECQRGDPLVLDIDTRAI